MASQDETMVRALAVSARDGAVGRQDERTVVVAISRPELRDRLCRSLKESFAVGCVSEAPAAAEAVRAAGADLVLLDAEMMDGLERASLLPLRTADGASEVPLILVVDGDERVDAAEVKADDVLFAPFSDRELAIRTALHIQRAERRADVDRALAESEQRYRAIVEGQEEMVCRFRPDGTVLFVNGAYARARGSTPEELTGENFWKWIAEEDRADVRAMLDRLRPDAPVIRIENRFETSEGIKWTLWTNRALTFDEEGRATEVQSAGIDITERKQAEESLRRSEHQLALILDTAPAHIAYIGSDCRFRFVNHSYAARFGAAPDQLSGRHIAEFIGQEAFERARPYMEEVLSGRAVEFEHDFDLPGMGRRYIHARYAPEVDADGEVRGFIAVVSDETDRVRMQEALQESERRQRIAATAAGLGVFEWDVEQDVIVWENDRMYEIFGRTREQGPVGREPFYQSYVHPEDRERVEDAIKHAMDPVRPLHVTFRIRREDGEEAWIEVAGNFIHDTEGRAVRLVGVVADITDRKRAERDQALLAAIVASSKDAIVSKTLDGIITSWNEGAEEVFGFTAEETIGRPITLIIPPDRYDEEDMILSRIQGGKAVNHYETVRRRKDGRLIDVSVSISPLYDGSGRIIGASKVARDITARKRAEEALRKSEERLRTLNQTLERRVAERTADLEDRNKELQAFAYIASHDLREPLRKIQAFSDLLQQDARGKLSEDGMLFLQRIASAAARMDGLLLDLLSFSRVATNQAPLAPVDLVELAADVLRDYELTIHDTKAEVTIEASVTVDADGAQLRQLLTNLVGNAFKYRRPGIVPQVSIRAEIVETEGAGENGAAGRMCRIVVEDNGIGFDPKFQERIFEPFERLHERAAYEGTGMGLAISRRIVQRHRGTIAAESRPGEGSRFIVHLPIGRRAET